MSCEYIGLMFLLTVQFEHGIWIPDYSLFEQWHLNTRLSGHLNTRLQVPSVFEKLFEPRMLHERYACLKVQMQYSDDNEE